MSEISKNIGIALAGQNKKKAFSRSIILTLTAMHIFTVGSWSELYNSNNLFLCLFYLKY